MDYTLETLKSILRKRLQDEEFDGDTLTLFLNQAQDEILGEDKYPFMQRIASYTADEEGEIYLPPGYAGTFQLFAKKSRQSRQPLKYISPEEFFANDHSTMVYTTFSHDLFYRICKPSDNEENCDCEDLDLIHLYLVSPLPLVKDSDCSPIPPQYIEALILGALYRAEQLRDNFDYAQIYQNQQDQLLTNMKLRTGPGNLSASNSARLPYFGGR